ncbi:MAG: ArsA family ATPase [Actinomycetia bacterium]|nr:ArsA family ATPase [Actinomycetes bacterium]
MSDLASIVEGSRVVVCCGSGGVGKTTTAAVLALEAARQGRRSVVVTIDPARRLADALGLEGLTNTPSRIDADMPGEMHALMLDTKSTFDGLVRRHSATAEQAEGILENRFYQNISSALSGTQEYMASEKLYELAEEGDWDLVVVDTPPTRNALDFLDAPQRLAHFLDHRLYKVLMTPTRGIVRAVNVAAQAVVRSMSKVVGGDVVADAIAFFRAFEGMEQGFKERAAAVDRLLAAPETAFILVASPKADTVAEASYFAEQLAEHGIDVRGLVVNRMQPAFGTDDEGLALGPDAARERANTLAGTDLGDLYTALADARQLARGEEDHLVGLTERVSPAPVVRVPVQPFEVNDLDGLHVLGGFMLGGAVDDPAEANGD